MKRLLLVGLALPLLALTACSGHSDPATNIVQVNAATGESKATVWATAKCDPGEYGWYVFRYRGTDWGSQPWADVSTPKAWDCRNQGGTSVAPGTYHMSDTVTNLAANSVYRFQYCAGLGDPINGFGGRRDLHACVNAKGELISDNASATSNPYNDDWIVTKPANVGADPAQPNTDTADGDAIQAKTSFQCEDTATACASGVGTGWACGPFSYKKSQWYGWGNIVTGPYKAWTAKVFGSWCWGTGKNRGRYKDYSGIGTNGDVTFVGQGYGWEHDGLEGLSGPTVQNGKLSFMRNVGFHKCTPPAWSVKPFHACIIKNDDNMKMQVTLWVDSTNHAHAQLVSTFVD